MNSRNRLRQLVVLRIAAILVLVNLFFGLPALRWASSETVKSLEVATAEDAAEPDGTIWKEARAMVVPLQTAPSVHTVISGVAAVQELTVQAVKTREEVYVRLSWRDETENGKAEDTQDFLDAAAVMFPLEAVSSTSIFMGNPGARVNIWYWKPGASPQNLIAEGFGTLSPASIQDITGKAVYGDGTWRVVLSRPLYTAAEDGVQLDGVTQVPIGLAVWDGANKERDGLKAVTMQWQNLELD